MLVYPSLTTMAKICAITKVGSVMGGRYSNRTRATQFNPCGDIRKYPNLQKKRIYIPELKKTVVITVSARGLRTIQKNGAFRALTKAGII
jgi:large subunit ribosomal protein L28